MKKLVDTEGLVDKIDGSLGMKYPTVEEMDYMDRVEAATPRREGESDLDHFMRWFSKYKWGWTGLYGEMP